jgi:transposase InsO family protein
VDVVRGPRSTENMSAESDRIVSRWADAGIELSVGSRGDAYDNALAETVIGLFKTEVIRRRGPWRSLEAVEFATIEWVDWFQSSATARTDRLPSAGGI